MRNSNGGSYMVKTLGEVAAFFGLAEQTCRAWRMRADPMPGDPGAWDLSKIARWRIEQERQRKPQSEDELLLDSADPDWKDRWVRAKALITEEQLAEVQGRLVDLDEIAPILRRMGTLVADGIRRLETEYGRDAADIMRMPLERLQEEVEGL